MNKTDLSNAMPEMALILAAGFGSRLRKKTNTPKPLTKVLGLTFAERVVCTLLDAGVQQFLVTLTLRNKCESRIAAQANDSD